MIGIFGIIVSVTVVELPLPTAFVAVTVKVAEESIALGVPLITQVLALIESPVGSAGVIEQPVTLEPLLFKVVGVTVIGTSHCPEVPEEPE
jgi:hypothetical protein